METASHCTQLKVERASDWTKVYGCKELSCDVSSSSSLKLLASAYSGSSSESSEEGEGFESLSAEGGGGGGLAVEAVLNSADT